MKSKLCDLNPAAADKLPPKMEDKSGIGVHFMDAYLKPFTGKLEDGTAVKIKRRGMKVTLTAVEPNKPMSFSSLNGDIDVTFPPEVKANASMKSDNGEIFSDFDVKLEAAQPQPATSEDARGKGGKYRIKIDRTTKGTINGGGPEMQFKTFNGNIYIRSSGKKAPA